MRVQKQNQPRAIVRYLFVSSFLFYSVIANGQQDYGPDIEFARQQVTPLIAMIQANLTGSDVPICGTGIVVGADTEYLYVTTASHVVWRGNERSSETKLTFRGAGQEKTVLGEVMKEHEPAVVNDQTGLDLAVIKVRKKDMPFKYNPIAFSRLTDGTQPAPGSRIYSIGYARGESKWDFGTKSEYLTKLGEGRFNVRTDTMVQGYSGGPVFNHRFQLIGFISEDSPPAVTAVSIDSVKSKFKTWNIPFSLIPGSGRVILTESDRRAYPLSDARGEILFNLATSNPSIKAYFDWLTTRITTFIQSNPNYKNPKVNEATEPRGPFYISTTGSGASKQVHTVEIYTESEYWPKSNMFPEMFLATRNQSVEFNIFKEAIDPKTFVPGSSRGDLQFSMSAGYVNWTSMARQMDHENKFGREVFRLNRSNQTLMLNSYLLNAPKNRWTLNPNVFDSLLDLRGAQIIIATVNGNWGGRQDLKATFDSIQDSLSLEKIWLGMDTRSIEFTSLNTKKYVTGINGYILYVFQFPKTSQEFLEVFKS